MGCADEECDGEGRGGFASEDFEDLGGGERDRVALPVEFGALAAGNYYYAVTGMGTGSLGGFYTISSSVTAVPEPETYAMMMAGLGVMGLLLKRSRPQN